VVEIAASPAAEKSRARVGWEIERDGRPMKLRTWVRFSDLEIIEDAKPAAAGFPPGFWLPNPGNRYENPENSTVGEI